MKLKLEVNQDFDDNVYRKSLLNFDKGLIMITPCLGNEYWIYKVQLSNSQAVIGFPKFGVIGIGVIKETKGWNTNLPSDTNTAEIYEHIKINKCDKKITKKKCIKAINMIKDYITFMKGKAIEN